MLGGKGLKLAVLLASAAITIVHGGSAENLPGRESGTSDATFDPDGFYWPTGDVKVGGLWLRWFALATNAAELEAAGVHSFARLALAGARDENAEEITYDTSDFNVTSDEFTATWSDTAVGSVRIRGRFVFGGRFADRSDIEPQRTIVLTGTVRLGGKHPVTKKADFTYWAGD